MTATHNKALTQSYTQKSVPLAGLSWDLSNTQPPPPQAKPNDKEKYLAHWKESTKNQSQLACYLSLNRGYTVAEYLTTVNDQKRRKSLTRYRLNQQTWLPTEDWLCSHCTQNQLETELHFLTSYPSCQSYQDIGNTYFLQITKMLTNCPDAITEKYNNVKSQQPDSSPVVMREEPQTPDKHTHPTGITFYTMIALLHTSSIL